jgi:hypothetical protein
LRGGGEHVCADAVEERGITVVAGSPFPPRRAATLSNTGSKAKRGQILWAEQLKPMTFELSDHEREVYARAAEAQ